ncbi:MAG: hypothetical protein KC591_16500 [Gemmatimonadetes bacterium]|nr:hypothetical protein [Gemmatimonadota bacterium]
MALLLVVLFREYLFSDLLLYGSDSIPSALFSRGYLVSFWKEWHEIPRWNPYILGGLPFIDATHGDTFFPLSIIHFLMPVYRALGHKLLVAIWLSGVCAAIYLRTLGLGRSAVTLGAVGYMLNPVHVSYLFAGQDGKMYVAALAPLALACLERSISRRRAVDWLILGLVLGLMILSAQIQMAYHGFWFVGGLFLMRLVWPRGGEPRGAYRGKIVGFASAVGLSLLVASVQLLPAVAYVKHPDGFSVRSGKTDYEHASSWSLHPEELASMVVPEFCNSPRGYWGRNPFKYNSDYLGLALILLAALAVARRRSPTRWFLLSMAGFAILYSLGEHTPVHRLAYLVIPQVKLFRAPPLIMFGASLGIASLAAFLVQDLVDGYRPRRSVWAAGGIAILLFLLGLSSRPATDAFCALFGTPFDEVKRGILSANLPAFRNGAFASSAIVAIVAAGLWAFRARRISIPVLTAMLVVVSVVDAWRIDRIYVMIVDPSRWTEARGALGELAAESSRSKFRVMPALQEFAMNELGPFRIESTLGFHDNELSWYREFRTDPRAQGLLVQRDGYFPLLAVLNTKWILHRQSDLPNPLPIAALERFWCVPQWEVLPRERILDRLLEPDFDPASVALLEESPPFAAEMSETVPIVTSFEYRGNEVRASVQSEGPCLLIHSENWFPYWRAEVNGREVPILRAFGTIRAIAVPAGGGDVVLRFHSTPYEVGKLLSLGALGVILGGVLWSRRRRRVAA